MSETEECLASVRPRHLATDTALHHGEAAPRQAVWSTTEPVTLLSAAMMTPGWPEIAATFDGLGSRFADCIACDSEVLAAGASGELAALVAFEHTTASIGGAPPAPYSLRVTPISRREAGASQVARRNADTLPAGASVRGRLSTRRSADAGEARDSA